MPITYVKPELLTLKLHPELDEKWVQKLIEDDPSALRLGDLQFRGRERIQPGGGRLDLLLQDPETNRRYEVEIQLGATDPSHIIRAIEYWDIERKRYPQYDHCAVLVAEDITSRFLNVISLFNGSIPLIAIQMQALRVGDHTTLVFTTVLGERRLGLDDEDDDGAGGATRADWENRAKATVAIADQLLEIIHRLDPSITLNYTQFYIGLAKDGRVDNFLMFHPRKRGTVFEIRHQKSAEIDNKIDQAGLVTLPYTRWGTYRLILGTGDVQKHGELLRELIRITYESRAS